jgi:hypothetical protein
MPTTGETGLRLAASSATEAVAMEELWMLAREALEILAREGLERWGCPSCPTAEAAREVFFSEGVLTRLVGAVGPFVVTAALAGLFVSRLGRLARRNRSGRSPALLDGLQGGRRSASEGWHEVNELDQEGRS